MTEAIRTALEALRWYASEAEALARHLAKGEHTDAVLASLTVLSLDRGTRAQSAIATLTAEMERPEPELPRSLLLPPGFEDEMHKAAHEESNRDWRDWLRGARWAVRRLLPAAPPAERPAPEHPECTHGPGFQMPTFTQSPLTEEDIRRIVREEIDRMRPVETRPYGE